MSHHVQYADGRVVECDTLTDAYARINGARRAGRGAWLVGMKEPSPAEQAAMEASNAGTPITQTEFEASA